MKSICSKYLLISVLGLFSSTSAFAAGATVTFSLPSGTSIPTLSSAMLLVLGLLLFTVALKTAKQKTKKNNNNTTFLLTVFCATGLLTVSGGVNLISQAKAGGTEIVFSSGTNSVQHRVSLGSIVSTFINNNPTAVNFSIEVDDDDLNHPSCSHQIDGPLTDSSPIQLQGSIVTGVLLAGSFINISCESD